MVGISKKFEPDEIIFRAGEPAKGMYIIRKGMVRVYLERPGREVDLLVVKQKEMLGEMSLIDHEPRSASARAIGHVEVSYIRREELKKVLHSIPKWFVSLMNTISTRLRQTNNYLHTIEAQYLSSVNPMKDVLKILNLIDLIRFKIADNTSNNWRMNQAELEKQLMNMSILDQLQIREIINILIGGKIIEYGIVDKVPHIFIAHKARLDSIIWFTTNFLGQNPDIKKVSDDFVSILENLVYISKEVPQKNFSIKLINLQIFAKKKQLPVEDWPLMIETMNNVDNCLQIKKKKGEITLTAITSGLPIFLRNARIVQALTQADLELELTEVI